MTDWKLDLTDPLPRRQGFGSDCASGYLVRP
jgi:hypothetical protein